MIFACLFIGNFAFSDDSARLQLPDSAFVITVKKDHRLDVLNRKQALINKRGTLKPHMVREYGYRLQLISTQKRDLALALKADMLNRFPSERVYLIYQSPQFRIRLGNFKTRQEAMEFKELYLSHLSEVFLVRDVIEYMWYPHSEPD